MTRDKNTVWIAGTAVLAALVLLGTYFLLIAPQRAEAADVATQTAGVQQQNDLLAQQTELLETQFATLDERRLELADITRTLPAEADVQQLLRQVETFAGSSGVTLLSVTPGAPVLHGVDATGGAAETTGPVIVDVPLVLTTEGPFSGTELFVKQLQADMGRFLRVDDLALAAGTTTGDEGVTTTVTGRVFVVRSAQTTEDQSGTASAAATNGSESYEGSVHGRAGRAARSRAARVLRRGAGHPQARARPHRRRGRRRGPRRGRGSLPVAGQHPLRRRLRPRAGDRGHHARRHGEHLRDLDRRLRRQRARRLRPAVHAGRRGGGTARDRAAATGGSGGGSSTGTTSTGAASTAATGGSTGGTTGGRRDHRGTAPGTKAPAATTAPVAPSATPSVSRSTAPAWQKGVVTFDGFPEKGTGGTADFTVDADGTNPVAGLPERGVLHPLHLDRVPPVGHLHGTADDRHREGGLPVPGQEREPPSRTAALINRQTKDCTATDGTVWQAVFVPSSQADLAAKNAESSGWLVTAEAKLPDAALGKVTGTVRWLGGRGDKFLLQVNDDPGVWVAKGEAVPGTPLVFEGPGLEPIARADVAVFSAGGAQYFTAAGGGENAGVTF